MMKRLSLPLVALSACAIAAAQQTKQERLHSTATDARPNSPAVPDVYAAAGQFERVVVLRFKFDTDLLAGLEKMMREQKIRNGVILTGMGSVRNYHVHVVSNRTFPAHDVFIKDPTKPADILGMSGYVIDGRVHAHITLADSDKAFGGHLESGTTAFAFGIVTIGVFKDGIDLSKVDDLTYR